VDFGERIIALCDALSGGKPGVKWRIQVSPDGKIKLTSGDYVVIAADDGVNLTVEEAEQLAAKRPADSPR
jgi:hypothetical protein